MSSAIVPNDARAWRPQTFGRRSARQISDPIIEPLWSGDRAMAHVQRGRAELFDEVGEPFIARLVAELIEAIEVATRAQSLVLDGYLTSQATRDDSGVSFALEAPSSGEMATQLLIGQRRRLASNNAVVPFVPNTPLAFVAIDVLAVDDQPLLDIPLLERKRLLESVLDETELVRRSAYVRPPVDPWLSTWRALGFGALAYKASNSRYRPGQSSDDWATALIPAR
jgi:hypothetical protein